MMTDPVADFLTRIRNAGMARHNTSACPSSKLKLAVAKLLSAEGFIGDVRVEARDGHAPMQFLLLRLAGNQIRTV